MEWKEKTKLMVNWNKSLAVYTNCITCNMKKYLVYLSWLVVLMLWQAPLSIANDATDNYQAEELSVASFDQKEWKDSKAGMQYSKKPKAKKKKKKRTNVSNGTGELPSPRSAPNINFQDLAQTLLIFFAVLILAFIILRVVAGDAILANEPVKQRPPISLEDIETNLQEADVEGFLKQALVEKNYRLAIRLYYLAIIKELAAKGIIEWKRDKTNGQYLRELRQKKHPQVQKFKKVTRIFEYVWYSNMTFEEEQFEEVRINFKNLLASIK